MVRRRVRGRRRSVTMVVASADPDGGPRGILIERHCPGPGKFQPGHQRAGDRGSLAETGRTSQCHG